MKKYKITASQTIYATYEIEVDAENEQQAEKRALATSMNDWDDERFENGDALTVDEIEEVQEWHNAMKYKLNLFEALQDNIEVKQQATSEKGKYEKLYTKK